MAEARGRGLHGLSITLLNDLKRELCEVAERRLQRKREGKDIWTRQILSRHSRKTNSNIAVTGEPGIGKSTLSLKMAELLRPDIFVDHPQEAIDKFVTFSGGELGRAIRDSPDGSLIIGDEFGQQMHHREFMSEKNVALSNVLQGFRFKRFISFLNLPGLHFIDVDAESLLTWLAIIGKRGEAEVHKVDHPKFKGKDFYPTFISRYHFSMPRPELWKVYVEKKIANQQRVFDQSIKVMDADESMDMSNAEIVEKIMGNLPDYQKAGKNRIDSTEIQSRFRGVGINRAYVLRRMVENELSKKEGNQTVA